MSITFEPNGEPIAGVLNTEDGDHYYLYLDKENMPQNNPLLDEQLPEHLVDVVTEQLKSGLSFNQVQGMLKIANKEEDEPEIASKFEAEPDELVFITPTRSPEKVSLFGQSGAGKSRLAAQYALQYSLLFPDRKIVIFCAQDEDPAFYKVEYDENGDPLRDENNKLVLKIDEKTGEPVSLFRFQEIILGDPDNPVEVSEIKDMSLNDLENRLVIFDDVDNIADEKMCKAIHHLVNLCYANGRRRNIHTVYIGHVAFAGVQNKVILQESNKIVFFPRTGAAQIQNYFNKKASMTLPEARKYATMEVDWLCLVSDMPRYLIHPKGIMII
jgi:hypothetical protein